MLARFSAHWARLRRELGQRLTLGERDFRVRGYLPNRLTTTFRHESYLIEPLRRAFAAKSGAIIDVGVNTGQTLLKVLTLDPTRRYIGFEPQIGCAYFVDQFIRDNDLANAEVICLAVGDRTAMLGLHAQGQYDEMASLYAASRERYTTKALVRYVPVRIGDEVLDEMEAGPVAVLKVDVEGAELEAFRGFARTIQIHKPVCFFEVLPNFVGEERVMIGGDQADGNRTRANALFTFFTEAGYEIRNITTQGEEKVIAAFDLDTPANFLSSDYVAYPRG